MPSHSKTLLIIPVATLATLDFWHQTHVCAVLSGLVWMHVAQSATTVTLDTVVPTPPTLKTLKRNFTTRALLHRLAHHHLQSAN